MSKNIDAGAVLNGRVALVTGGAHGIGAAIAKRLATDGATVALTDIAPPDDAAKVVRAIEAVGGKARAIQADVRDADAVISAVKETVASFGRLDILVNAAGVFVAKPLEDFSVDDFQWLVDVHVKSIFVAVKEAVKHLGEGGRIINIGSINSDYIPYNGGVLYALTKAAVSGLTKALSRDLGPRGITINNVKPGPTNTDMNPADDPAAPSILDRTAVKRFAAPEEIADFVAFIASPKAGFITGANLSIDGGYTA
ncbi:SDR family NAD(P)-dependent oxidoreductase [Sinorhizobium fredii]|uniref:SDR family NAD(P)-dependent oxidoreductase n=1 Tax=Rhizobium fredii TaxID=380 RepID=UPI0004B393AB|nr:3-oxoacyl-ACP reductase family protein [Sinorhizobium fredii]ASY73825.1 3-oxoacyl-[acyl-carrier protein] reductase [Sinorhizobium fredii CCBAU 83666]